MPAAARSKTIDVKFKLPTLSLTNYDVWRMQIENASFAAFEVWTSPAPEDQEAQEYKDALEAAEPLRRQVWVTITESLDTDIMRRVFSNSDIKKGDIQALLA